MESATTPLQALADAITIKENNKVKRPNSYLGLIQKHYRMQLEIH